MSIKHKVLKDFQLVTSDKKIIILKAKSLLIDYKYTTKNDTVLVEKEVVDNNPDFFSPVDWKEELINCLKQNKIPQPAVVTKKLVPFIEEMFIINENSSNNNNSAQLTSAQLEELNQREIEFDLKTRKRMAEISEKEIEIDTKLRKAELKEKQVQLEVDDFQKREDELIRKEKLFTEKELKLKRIERDLQDKENNLDRTILESNTNLDTKQQEMNDKVESRIKEITQLKSQLDDRENELILREQQKQQEFTIREDEIKKREEDLLNLEGKIRNLDKSDIINTLWSIRANTTYLQSIRDIDRLISIFNSL